MKAFIAILSLIAAAVAAPAAEPEPVALAARNCGSVPGPQTWIQDRVLSICRSRGCSQKALLATFETATVESNWNNLPCGDQDSLGVFQQRPSQGWGSPGQLQNVDYSTNAFLDRCIPADQSHSWFTAGQLAQFVQGSERPDAYDQARSRAQSFLDAALGRAGGGGGGGGDNGAVNVASAPKKAAPKPAPAPAKSSSSKAAPKNVASGTIRSGCKNYHTVQRGNTCFGLHKQFNISVSHFLSINKGVHSSCNNLQVGKAYCVQN